MVQMRICGLELRSAMRRRRRASSPGGHPRFCRDPLSRRVWRPELADRSLPSTTGGGLQKTSRGMFWVLPGGPPRSMVGRATPGYTSGTGVDCPATPSRRCPSVPVERLCARDARITRRELCLLAEIRWPKCWTNGSSWTRSRRGWCCDRAHPGLLLLGVYLRCALRR